MSRREEIGELRHGLCRPDTDTDWYPDVPAHGRPHLGGMGDHPAAKARQVHKRLVDRVDFRARREVGNGRGHAPADVAVEGIIRREQPNAMLSGLVLEVMSRFAHADPKGFRFRASGNGAAIVVAQDDNGLTFEFRIKKPLAGDIKVIAINQGDGFGHGYSTG